jgi:hypothetical protein
MKIAGTVSRCRTWIVVTVLTGSTPVFAAYPADPTEWPPFETRFSQMFGALDWVTAEDSAAASPLQAHVAFDRVAAMGHSCGALQTVTASVDPRITTAVVLNSGMMPDGDQYMIRHELERSILQRMHTSIACFIGGEDCGFCTGGDWHLRRHFPD